MASIFTKIINREIPANIVAEDDSYIAFLDINPLREGHTLVVPKKEVDYIFDMDHQSLAGLFSFAKRVARAIEAAVECNRIGISVIGLEVPHAHVHLVPIDSMDDINFSNMKLSFSREEMAKMADKIKAEFA